MPRLASIDIGTNTLRLLIGEVTPEGRIKDTMLDRKITRLGGGFNGAHLHPDSRVRTMAALQSFSETIKNNDVKKIRTSATSVMRDAEDGIDFVREIREKTGITVEIISGDEEAALTLQGVLSALEGKEKEALIFDIGGGSTEYIVADAGQLVGARSINMGVVSLTESHLKSDPPSESNIAAISASIDEFLQGLKSDLPRLTQLGQSEDAILVGTAGTITTLAALDQNLEVYDSRKINNYILTKDAIETLFKRLVSMTHQQRADMAALEEGRADLIIAGTIIVLETMKEYDFEQMVVSDYGLLEGLLIDLARKEGLIS